MSMFLGVITVSLKLSSVMTQVTLRQVALLTHRRVAYAQENCSLTGELLTHRRVAYSQESCLLTGELLTHRVVT